MAFGKLGARGGFGSLGSAGARAAVIIVDWILQTGAWVDAKHWNDTALWIDSSGAFSPSLDFSDARNSQYLSAVGA